MTKNFHFDGIIKNVSYNAQLTCELETVEFLGFDVNTVNSQGIINLPNERLAYSKWDSPTQAKSYPFARIYDTYDRPRRITIIPVMKEDGLSGKLDNIQYSTLSWMNLANVYIIFAYYDEADKSKRANQQKLINQRLNAEIVNSQIDNLINYHSSAIHWNRSQFGDRFKKIYRKAIYAYEKISAKTKVETHPRDVKLEYLNKMRKDCRKYEGISIDGLKGVDISRDRRLHDNQYVESIKSVFYLIDGYGGIYYLTAKDVWRAQNNTFVIQETRFSNRNFLPPIQHIQDGLFRLVFFGNIDALYRNGHQIRFQTRLSLFGNAVRGTLYLPCNDREFNAFIRKNKNAISKDEMETIGKLRLEVEKNQGLVVEIGEKQ